MKKINRKLIKTIPQNPQLARALALAIYIKLNVTSSSIKECTTNKIHSLTGLHANTIKKRLMTLKEFGLIETTENNTTTFKTLKSSNDRLNVLFDFTKFNTVSELEYALYAIILIEKIRNKEYIKKELERLKKLPKPKDSKESTKVKKEYKKFKKIFYKHKMPSEKPITDEKYDEYGISLSTITKLLGVAREKAHKIVKFAIRHNLITKKKRVEQIFIYGIGRASKFWDEKHKNYTFCTKNNAYKVHANVYHLIEDYVS